MIKAYPFEHLSLFFFLSFFSWGGRKKWRNRGRLVWNLGLSRQETQRLACSSDECAGSAEKPLSKIKTNHKSTPKKMKYIEINISIYQEQFDWPHLKVYIWIPELWVKAKRTVGKGLLLCIRTACKTNGHQGDRFSVFVSFFFFFFFLCLNRELLVKYSSSHTIRCRIFSFLLHSRSNMLQVCKVKKKKKKKSAYY